MSIEYTYARIMMKAMQSLGFYAEIADYIGEDIASSGGKAHGPVLMTNANETEFLTLWDEEYIDYHEFHEKYDSVSEEILSQFDDDDWCHPQYVYVKPNQKDDNVIHCAFFDDNFVDVKIKQSAKYSGGKIIGFYSKGDYPQLSNFYITDIKTEKNLGDGIVEATTWTSVEHYFQYQKALEFNPGGRAIKAMSNELSCKEIKALGKMVQNFAPAVWNIRRRFHMRDAVAMKFRQNTELRELLLATGDAVLAEASPRDTFWGIGYSGSNPKAHDPAEWRGKNVLGNMLMHLRDAIRAEAQREET